ncbi:MAG: 30S ribosomal protein S16 [bacterium]|nr:30S ribosomal protein S16 [bacterium]
MVKIRLTRTGRKNLPSYRIVAIEHTTKRDGQYIEILGFFNPSKNPAEFQIDKDKVNEWVKNGAQVSDSVQELIDGTYKYVKYEPNKKEEVAKKSEEVVDEKEKVAEETPVVAEEKTEVTE